MNKITRNMIKGDWAIAYRKKQDLLTYDEPFIPINNTKEYWFADPLFFEYEGKDYLFVEAYNKTKKRGELGVFLMEDGEAKDYQTIISEDYHLSYPFVFEYENSIYMIPESGANMTLDLYKASSFPYKWEKVKSLLTNIKVADPTIYEYENILYLILQDLSVKATNYNLYKLDMVNCELEKVNSFDYQYDVGRPGGKVFKHKDLTLRPAQNCKDIYGGGLLFYKINQLEPNYEEELYGEIDNSKVQILGRNKLGVNRVHTYSQTQNYEVIDYMIHHFDAFGIFKKIIKKMRG